MTVNGHVKNGQIVLDEAVPLAEGMKVRVELLTDEAAAPQAEEPAPTLYERKSRSSESLKICRPTSQEITTTISMAYRRNEPRIRRRATNYSRAASSSSQIDWTRIGRSLIVFLSSSWKSTTFAKH